MLLTLLVTRDRNFTVNHVKFSLQMATMCIKYADKRAIFRHIVDFANASTKYFHSGYLVTEFNMIYSKIPVTSLY